MRGRSSEIAVKEDVASSFTQLYDTYQKMIRGTLFKLCGSSHLDDLVQDAFIKIWNGISHFEHRSSLKTWVYSIVVRVGLDHLRKHRAHMTLVELDSSVPSSMQSHEISFVYRDLIMRGLQGLSPDHRVVLVLHLYEGLSLEEIAHATKSKAGTVKSRLHYAKKTMGDFLKANGVRYG